MQSSNTDKNATSDYKLKSFIRILVMNAIFNNKLEDPCTHSQHLNVTSYSVTVQVQSHQGVACPSHRQ